MPYRSQNDIPGRVLESLHDSLKGQSGNHVAAGEPIQRTAVWHCEIREETGRFWLPSAVEGGVVPFDMTHQQPAC